MTLPSKQTLNIDTSSITLVKLDFIADKVLNATKPTIRVFHGDNQMTRLYYDDMSVARTDKEYIEALIQIPVF